MVSLRLDIRSFSLLLSLVGACSSSASPAASPPTNPAPEDAAAAQPTDAGEASCGDGAADACSSGLDGRCATSFGNALTDGFARIDGVVYALQMPNDQSCTMPNKDHLIVQVLMNGAVYRMVVNTDVKVAMVEHAVPSPAFAEGWHTGVALDYPTILGAHSPSFVAKDMAGVVASVTSELHVGDPVSIYATSESYPDSAHLVHRNTNAQSVDGAIVAHPTTSPKFILFAFDNQTF